MPSDLDIYRAAQLLIQQRGEKAEPYALRRCDTFLQANNLDASIVWLRIAHAIAQLMEREAQGSLH